jgi:hypothetical protein
LGGTKCRRSCIHPGVREQEMLNTTALHDKVTKSGRNWISVSFLTFVVLFSSLFYSILPYPFSLPPTCNCTPSHCVRRPTDCPWCRHTAGKPRVKVRRQLREICPINGGWAMKKPSHGRPVYCYTSELHDSLCLHNLTIRSQLSRYAPSLSLYFRLVLSSCLYPLNMAPSAFPLPFVWFYCSAVASMVEALCYKPQSCGFESLIRALNFSNLPNPSSRTRPWDLLSL